MIFVFEPVCRGNEHERVNAGFLSAIAAAYPGEAMRLHAECSHCVALTRNLEDEQRSIPGLEFRYVRMPRLGGRFAILSYRRIFEQTFKDLLAAGAHKAYFLSFNVEAMLAIKQLKQQARFASLKFTFVLHGLIETIIHDQGTGSDLELPISELPHRTLAQKLRRAHFSELPSMVKRGGRSAFMKVSGVRAVVGTPLKVRHAIDQGHCPDYRYVCLASHAKKNAARYMDPSRFAVFAVTMPVSMLPPAREPANAYVKLAVYGNADQIVLHNVARAIEIRKPRARYEIRVVGQSHFGAEGVSNVCTVGQWGKKLSRAEMEYHARDIDLFLLLSDKNKYRLTCSGVLFEAFSLVKPVVYFANECVDQFNTPETPLGYRCESFEDLIEQLMDIIERFDEHRPRLSTYRAGILRRRAFLAVEDNAAAVRQSFEW